MQNLRIASYKISQGTFPEVADAVKEGLVKIFKNEPGFLSYGLADTGNSTCVSVSAWENHDQAEDASLVAATWVREHLAERVELRSNQVGDLAFFESMPARV
jgi:Antibiotic biosynthesis monooxygenase.